MAFRDYEEFIAALNAHGARYLIVGGHAVALHARPRATKDLDIYLEASPDNAVRVLAALREFFEGADLGYSAEDLIDPESIIQIGVAPVRIDLISAIPGQADFSTAWEHRVDGPFGSVPAHYIGLEDLIDSKRTTNRSQDRADLRSLERARERKRTHPHGENKDPKA